MVGFSRRIPAAGAALLLANLCSCNAPRVQSIRSATDAATPPHSSAKPSPPHSAMFQDVAVEAGLNWRHTNGPANTGRIVEVIGGGCAFLDFDNDGLLDIVLVSCGDFSTPGSAAQPRIGLFHNLGNGKFEDV